MTDGDVARAPMTGAGALLADDRSRRVVLSSRRPPGYAYAEEFRHDDRQRSAHIGAALAFVLRYSAKALHVVDRGGWASDPVEGETIRAVGPVWRAVLPILERRSREFPAPRGRTGDEAFKGEPGRPGKKTARDWANRKLLHLGVPDEACALLLQAWGLGTLDDHATARARRRRRR
jgi:hypothetical protein